MGFAADSRGSAMSADQELNLAPTFVGPHPRHRVRSLHDRWYITGTQHHHDEQFHLVDNDFDPAPHYHNEPAAGHDDDRCSYCGGSPCWLWCPYGPSSDSVPTGDREPDPRALGPVRTGGRELGDRDRLARVELPARRSEPHWLLLDLPDGPATPQGHLRGGWLSRLVRRTLRRQGLGSGRSVALCVLGLLTLAALAREVL